MCERRQMAPCGHAEIGTQLRLTIAQLKPVYERVGRLCQVRVRVRVWVRVRVRVRMRVRVRVRPRIRVKVKAKVKGDG